MKKAVTLESNLETLSGSNHLESNVKQLI